MSEAGESGAAADSGGPVVIDFSDEELDQLIAAWERKRHGKPRLLTPLPRRVRLRLAVTHLVDRVAIWLCDRKRFRAAELLWSASNSLFSRRRELMAAGPQRRTVRAPHLMAQIAPVELALNARAKAIEDRVADAENPVVRMEPAEAAALTGIAQEFRALAEELHWW